MSAFIDTLAAHAGEDRAAVLVTVASVRGSAPREAGARMVVTRSGTEGTVGGGNLELACTEQARAMLDGNPGDRARLVRFPLGPGMQQCCGGAVSMLFETIGAADRPWLAALAGFTRSAVPVIRIGGAEGPCAGRRLLVSAGERVGSLGPDALDAEAIAAARALLAAPREESGTQLRALGGAELGNVVLLDPLLPTDFQLVLFGAGHVGRAVVEALGALDCRITWVDSRVEAFPARVPASVRVIATDAPELEVDRAPAGACVLVMTHSHAIDFELVERALRRDDLQFVGLIGSQPKRNRFVEALAIEGVPEAAIGRLTCPIGVPGIAGKEPATIAIAVAAQLLQVREAATRSAATSAPGSAARSAADSAATRATRSATSAETAGRERRRRQLAKLGQHTR